MRELAEENAICEVGHGASFGLAGVGVREHTEASPSN